MNARGCLDRSAAARGAPSSWLPQLSVGTAEQSTQSPRLAFPIHEEKNADKYQRHRPHALGQPSAPIGQAELEPASPAGDEPEQGERSMGDLHEELSLDVVERVRMREEQRAPDSAEQRKHVGPAWALQTTRPHHPLEDPED